MAGEDNRISSNFFTAASVLILATFFLYFYHLGEEDVSSEAEARVLLTVQEMNRNDTWLLPTIGGQGLWEKPPFYVWCVKAVSLFRDGEINPRIGRVPGALAIFLLVLLGGWWQYLHLKRHPRADDPDMPVEGYALLTGLLLATSPEIFNLAREGVSDSVFALFCFAALFCLGESFEMRQSWIQTVPWRRWVMLSYFFIGLAMLTKGPFSFLFVLIPYVATCLNYKLYKPNKIHFAGVALALVVGGWWYVFAMIKDPEAARIFSNEVFTRRIGPDAVSSQPIYFYFKILLGSFIPWNILALVMAYRNLRHIERTPTLLTWSWALVAGTLWLSLVSTKRDEYFLPVMPFILLLAGDALSRWQFDLRPGWTWRGVQRIFRWAGIIAMFLVSLLIGSDFGVGLAIALAIFCGWFAFHRFRSSVLYAKWERTIQGAAILVVVFFCAETIYIRDYIPRKAFLSQRVGFAERVADHLPEDAKLFFYGEQDAALYSWLLERDMPVTLSVEELIQNAGPSVYMVTDEDVPELSEHPRLALVMSKIGGDRMRDRAGYFKVLNTPDADSQVSLEDKYEHVEPLRIAVIGDAGEGSGAMQHDVAKRMDKFHGFNPYHETFIIGDALQGNSRLSRLDFYKKFERPYKQMLKDGMAFHAVLGERDQDIAWAVTRYPLFQMGGDRYYDREFYGGLVEFFALDAAALDDESHEQWAWIERQLEKSDAVWKIVGIHRPILSMAERGNKTDDSIARRLLPMLQKYKVNLVLWGEEQWYQRVKDPELFPAFLGVGFSGNTETTTFRDDPRLQMSYYEMPGFLILEITPRTIHFKVINERSIVIDEGLLDREGNFLEMPEPKPKVKKALETSGAESAPVETESEFPLDSAEAATAR